MEVDSQRYLSFRAARRGAPHGKDLEGSGGWFADRAPQEPLRVMWKGYFFRLFLVSAVAWLLLIFFALAFHVWSCRSSISFLSAACQEDSKVLVMLDTMGFGLPQQHRCPIPLASDPDSIVIPERRTPETLLQNLSYVLYDKPQAIANHTQPLFGGHESWEERGNSFVVNSTMQVHCGFIKNAGADMDEVDVKYVHNCRFVVASGIFDGYDIPHQPANLSSRSAKLFCFLMVVDEVSIKFMKENSTVHEDADGGKWVGIWRLVTLHNPPYDEPRRNGKVPKILTHRLFPEAQYSIWIDGKMELIVDPLLILERYLWRGKYTFAIACHKHHKSIYEEADANKRRKRYARPLLDLHMKIYRYEGLEMWSPLKGRRSDVPEGAVIIREHTPMTNLFSCLWFNEVDLFTPRDQLSFGYVAYRLGEAFKFFMFPNCEYNSLFILHAHTREHSSKIEWVKSLGELQGANSNLKESRGGLGLWTPYPGNLSSVELPVVKRSSPAG